MGQDNAQWVRCDWLDWARHITTPPPYITHSSLLHFSCFYFRPFLILFRNDKNTLVGPVSRLTRRRRLLFSISHYSLLCQYSATLFFIDFYNSLQTSVSAILILNTSQHIGFHDETEFTDCIFRFSRSYCSLFFNNLDFDIAIPGAGTVFVCSFSHLLHLTYFLLLSTYFYTKNGIMGHEFKEKFKEKTHSVLFRY